MSDPITVNQQEAASLLGVSTRTLYNWQKEGIVKPLPQFKRPRYSVAQLRRTFDKQDDAA